MDSRYSRLSINEDDKNGHVLFGTFGLQQATQHGLIDQLLRETPAVRPTAAAQLSLMAYQTDYGIYDHVTQPDRMRPLALMALHDKENAWEGGPMFSLVRRYHTYRIYEQGYSLTEFWDLPYPIAAFILEMAEDAIRQKDSAATAAENELAKGLKGVKA
ncbi:hypothetical protein D3C87_1278450 [compost metagenome]